ncbi:MAG: glycosyltransferase, partial [Bacteroidota bacterium]
PEYLASGVPIVVHCPGDYFLAAFFREHACGLVISVRDENEITAQLTAFLANKPLQMEMVARARALKYLFEPELNA